MILDNKWNLEPNHHENLLTFSKNSQKYDEPDKSLNFLADEILDLVNRREELVHQKQP